MCRVSTTSLPLSKEPHERMDVRFIRAHLNRTNAEGLEQLAAALHCRGPPLRIGLADGPTGGVHDDVSPRLQVLQLKKAETWQAEFTPVGNANGNDIMTPVGNTQRRLVPRG
jgi:hypothetical protein